MTISLPHLFMLPSLWRCPPCFPLLTRVLLILHEASLTLVAWKGLLCFEPVLVCLGCYNRNTIDYMTWTKETYSSQFWNLERLRYRCWSILFLGRILLLVCGWLPSCCVVTWQREVISLVSLLMRALIPFIGASPLWPNYASKSSPPNAITLGIWMQYMNLGWGAHKYSVHSKP